MPRHRSNFLRSQRRKAQSAACERGRRQSPSGTNVAKADYSHRGK
jgi:hypothetical protein